MAQSPDVSGLQPIMKRSLSPNSAVSNAAARSPSFINSPTSPNSSTANLNTTTSSSNTPPSYFSQSHAGSTPMSGLNSSSSSGHQSPSNNPPPTPGILLNKHDNNSTTTLKDHTHRTQSPPPVDSLLRVSSPTSASDSGFSSTSQDGGGGTNSPPPALGSPVTSSSSPTSTLPTHYKPALEAVLTSDLKRSTPSPPSPHCHFAPLPKPDERPQSRRSSIVSGRVKPFIPRPPERSESMSTAAGDNNDEALASGEYTPSLSPTVPGSFFPSHPQSSSEHFSALSQRLSSSLTFAAPTARHPSSPSRPTSRRSSSSRRSRSPSPPGLFRERDRTNSSTSRTHSPNLSRRPSTDALSLHYIEAGAEGRGVNLSRQNSRAGSERGPPEDALTMSPPSASGGSGLSRPRSTERRSTFDMTKSSSSSGGMGSMVDKDKEADLHRLMEKAQHGNLDAERAVSPALQAKEKREREASVGRGRSDREMKGPETEVVEVPRGAESETEELEEVREEEEEDVNEEEENEDEEEDNDEENDSQEDEEEEEEPDRSRDEDDEDDEDDEEEPAEERKTSKGAAVEVVRWHRDDPQPASSTNDTIPEDSLAEQEAEEETIAQSQNNSRRPSAIGTPISTD